MERTLFLLALLSLAGSSRWAAATAVFGGAFVGRLNANILEVNECSIHTQSQPVRSRQAQAEFAWMTNCRVRSVYLELENMLLMNLLWFLFPHTHTHGPQSVFCRPALPHFQRVASSSLAPGRWVKSGSSTNGWRTGPHGICCSPRGIPPTWQIFFFFFFHKC